MGSNSSKFKKYVQNGDEYAAMQVYQSSPDLRKTFDPNLSFGESRNHNTAMHYAARHGMKHLLRTFLTDLGGDPNKRNAFDETVLHAACSPGSSTHHTATTSHISISCVQLTGTGGTVSQPCRPPSPGPGAPLTASAQERRAACIALLLQWRGPAEDRVQLDTLDRDGSSALHLAGGAGLAGGCRLLLAAGARSLPRDSRGRTAARRALANGHTRLAALLQRAMLFSEEPVEWCLPRWAWPGAELAEQRAEEALGGTVVDTHEGLRPQELREAKDRLLVDTSDMLRVPLFAAEALLRDNEWCKDVLVERWMKDAPSCCQSAGVSMPGGSLDSEHPEENIAGDGEQKTIECGICCEEVPLSEASGGSCRHVYCLMCWARYLSGRVRDGDARPACPAPRCRRPAPQALLQRCLSPATQRKYLMFDIKAFVESSRGMKWCPIAGCGRAVRLLEPESSIPSEPASSNADNDTISTGGYPAVSRAVDCGDFHFFCWECHGESHAPLGCTPWNRWVSRAGAAPLAPLAAASGGAESAASSLWLLAHCKPCPSCACPIQKNDGCNHMKCTKCKFDFCWVCLESWKRHGSATGGYFRCTREEAAARADHSRGQALAEARVQNVEAQEQWRFAVQCARYRRHEQRWATEKPLLAAIPAKAKALDPQGAGGGALEGAARELALCRRVLAGSCAYTFVLPATAPHRAAFHYAQEELERCVCRLSGLVAREVVEAPLLAVRRAAAATRRWRLTLLRLARPPPPPQQLSAPELRLMSRLLSRGRLDPRDPWRFPLGPRGEPLRVPDPFDPDHTILQEPQLTVSPRPPSDRSAGSSDGDVYRINVSEYNMDLIIALEMSRLQMLEEQARSGRTPDTETSSSSQDGTLNRSRQRQARLNISVSIGGTSDYEDKLSLSDDQLKLAIQLSLQEPLDCVRAGAPGDKDAAPGSSQGPTWAPDVDTPDTEDNRTTRQRQEERWSRAADITVEYFLQALGGATNLDRLYQGQGDAQEQQGSEEGRSGQSNKSSRPPLLRWGCALPPQRPPLLRQLGGRRSWSMGDISVRSSSTDDTNNPYRMGDDPYNAPENGQASRLLQAPQQIVDASTLPHPHRSDKSTHYTITKNIQIDALMQQCDVKYDIVKASHSKATPERYIKTNEDKKKSNVEEGCSKDYQNFESENKNVGIQSGSKSILQDCTSKRGHFESAGKSSHVESSSKSGQTECGASTSKGSNKEDRKKLQCYPKNLPWGEFCCEKKCVKTGPESNQSPTKKERNLSKSSIHHPETEAPTKVSVDCRGKINPEIFDFSEKTIHLPDLNSSHLKVNTYLTKLAIDKHIGLLGETTMQFLNQNEIVSDNFRRHSDHIPRGERGQEKVKASSSEKHIAERLNRPPCIETSPDRVKLKAGAKSICHDSPKKSSMKTEKAKNIPPLCIRICEASQDKPDVEESNMKIKRGLETDSSNECESETGIPKSPTLYISGVSICRETSPKTVSNSNSNSETNVSRSNSQYGKQTNEPQQKSPKIRQKLAWKDYKDVQNALPTSPVIVHVTSPSLSPCSERNTIESITGCTSYSSNSPELYTPSLLRSHTPTGPMISRHMTNFSDENDIMELPVLPPSHFSDDVFLDDDDPGLMMDCTTESVSSSHHHGLRGTVYTGCHSGGIMISNMATLSSTQEFSPSRKSNCSPEYSRKISKSEEAVYENIFPQSAINDQLAFEMSLPNSPTGVSIASAGPAVMQKSWSARNVNPQDSVTEDSQANAKLKSKSANEPERDREMFHFPKSSTDGALSSVLHVQESNLSSDDFHEALFLLERSPKTRDSKRRKRSKKREKSSTSSGNCDKDAKKDRDGTNERKGIESVKNVDDVNCEVEKKKVNDVDDVNVCCTIDNDSPSNEQDEVSSAL